MALKDQPYIPLYIQDVLTDEKLMECSAESHGVYFRLICVLHKQKTYGKLLLKQKYKQTGKQVENFALSLVRSFPFDLACIRASLLELLEEDVLQIEGDYLVQKRMVKDAELSEKRSSAGRKGGKNSRSKDTVALPNLQANLKAKGEASPEDEDAIENESESEVDLKESDDFLISEPLTKNFFSESELWLASECKYRVNSSDRSLNLKKIKLEIIEQHKLDDKPIDDESIFETFKELILTIDPWIKEKKFSMGYIADKMQEIYTSYRVNSSPQPKISKNRQKTKESLSVINKMIKDRQNVAS